MNDIANTDMAQAHEALAIDPAKLEAPAEHSAEIEVSHQVQDTEYSEGPILD